MIYNENMLNERNFNQMIGEAIKKARISKGLTMKELGDHFGLHRSTINNYETGLRPMNVDLFFEFVSYLNIDFVEFRKMIDKFNDNENRG